MKPRSPKEKQERPIRHGCVQAGHARIETLRREPLIRARSVRKAKGPAYSRYLSQARDRIAHGKRRREACGVAGNVDPLFDCAVRRVHRLLLALTLPVELLLTAGGLVLLYRSSQQMLMAGFLAFPLFLLVRVVLRHLIRGLVAPTDVLVRQEYERLSRADPSQRALVTPSRVPESRSRSSAEASED